MGLGQNQGRAVLETWRGVDRKSSNCDLMWPRRTLKLREVEPAAEATQAVEKLSFKHKLFPTRQSPGPPGSQVVVRLQVMACMETAPHSVYLDLLGTS